MGRASVAAAGFALAAGAEADPAGVVHIAPVPDRFGRILLACVEPLDHSPRGRELAAVALRALREAFAATPGSSADALMASMAIANAAVMAENRPLTAGRWERRICVGATGIALADREIIVVQAAPTQAIVVQDGQVYAFPDVASWRGDFVPDAPLFETQPLGFAEEMAPRVFESEAAAGDLIVLCASGVGRVLARDEEATGELHSGVLLTDDIEGSVDRLERLLARHDVTDAFAVVASVSRLPSRASRRARGRRAASAEPGIAGRNAGPPAYAMAPFTKPTAPVSPALSASLKKEEPPVFEGLRDWAVDLAELVSAGRRQRPPMYAARERALAAPGALSVQRYRESTGLPPEWRANLPRGPWLHVPARLLAVTFVLVVALGGTGVAVGRQQDRAARAESALVLVDAALRRAQEHPGTSMSAVAEAERAMTLAYDAGATGEALTRREGKLAHVRDTVWGIQRLRDVARLGALPHELGGSARLALSGQTLLLAAGDLYELDRGNGRLVALLSRGDVVAENLVGEIRHVSLDDGDVVASDGTATYKRDEAGRWQRQPLAVADVSGLRDDAPVVAWGEAAYGLSWEGDIVRFDRSASGPLVNVWADADDVPDLDLARDFAIDGRIHVLLEDGRLLTFSRGELVGTMAPFVAPVLSAPSFIAAAPFSNAFYIVDHHGSIGQNAGRIVRVGAAGDAVQYMTPAPVAGDPESAAAAVALASADDLVVDELAGAVYWVSEGEIWRASLPVT